MTTLPIDATLPALRAALHAKRSAVLVAEPGAGKTTRVPLALLHEPWLEGRRILMLEPRRLAARAAARYMAALLGEEVGETVGYRVRMESRVGPRTRIEVITEGVLTRLLQTDPALEAAGLIIFDEFHERSLHADLGLALCLQSRALLRDDLRILVMSATLAAEPVAALLGDAEILTSAGRSFPVETRYRPLPVEGRMEPAVARTVLQALTDEQGDILVFLPGAAEIRRVEALLGEARLPSHVRIAPLHGSLPQEAQDLAISPGRPGERKVVLASAIAETSLTVEGVRVVVDSGLMRVPRFSPRTGMSRLETVPVSRASADQRRGRAGRLGPGVCYRLWTEQEDRRLLPQGAPEILEADLAPLALELAAWGADPADLAWLDPLPAAALGQARELLAQLGALSGPGRALDASPGPQPDGALTITPHGRRMAALGLHPRLAHMLLRATELGLGDLACDLAALLNERDLLRGGDADLRLRVEALRSAAVARAHGAEEGARRRIQAEADQLRRTLSLTVGPAAPPSSDLDACGLLLAFAYPDRIAQRRAPGQFLLSGGRGAAFTEPQPLADEPFLIVADLADQGADGRIFLAAPISLAALEEHFGPGPRQADGIRQEEQIYWDRQTQSVRARTRAKLGALTLRDAQLPNPDPERVLAALLEGIALGGLTTLPWTKGARQLQQRLIFLHRIDPAWPDGSDEALTRRLSDWLAPYLYGMRTATDLQRVDLAGALESLLSHEQRRELESAAPTHILVPSGSRIAIDYADSGAPVLAVRLQEMFGCLETPRIARGKMPLTVHLLSPAHRPVQVTRDLASFWRSAYFEVKKDLKGRYPKHYWPDDPLTATPTNRVRPRP